MVLLQEVKSMGVYTRGPHIRGGLGCQCLGARGVARVKAHRGHRTGVPLVHRLLTESDLRVDTRSTGVPGHSTHHDPGKKSTLLTPRFSEVCLPGVDTCVEPPDLPPETRVHRSDYGRIPSTLGPSGPRVRRPEYWRTGKVGQGSCTRGPRVRPVTPVSTSRHPLGSR